MFQQVNSTVWYLGKINTVPSHCGDHTPEPLSCTVVETIELPVVGLTTVVCPIF